MKLRSIGSILLAAALLLSFEGNINRSVFHNEQDHSSEIRKFSTSDDTYADSQWYIKNSGHYINYSDKSNQEFSSNKGIDMNVAKAWDYIKKAEKAKHEVVVAVIDTGIDYNHPDLANNIWTNPGEIPGDNIDNDNNGFVDDVHGWDFYNQDASVYEYEEKDDQKIASYSDNDNHGTHVAGIIAAVANNNQGIAGVASDVNIKIMSLKVNGGPNGSGNMEDAVKAIKYAEKMGAKICNISWGALGYTEELRIAIKQSKMLFVAAAGNFASNNDEQPVYPSNFGFDNLISVTAVDSMGALGEKADYGVGSVDIAAPGIDIYSTVVGGYDYMSGTSMAAPQVSAVAALAYAEDNRLSAVQVKNLILNHIKPLPQLKGFVKHEGIPDAYELIKAAGELNQKNEINAKVYVNNQTPMLPGVSSIKDQEIEKRQPIQDRRMGPEDILQKDSTKVIITLFGEFNTTTTELFKQNKTLYSDWKRRSRYRRI